MGKKLFALALVGAAAYLYKTKKGAEIRKQAGAALGKTVQTLRDKYTQASGAVQDSIDAQTA